MNARLGTHTGGVSPPQLAPCPKPPMSHSLPQYGVKFKMLHQRDCSSLQGTALLRQHNDNHPNGPRWQSYNTEVFTGGSTASQTQRGVQTGQRFNNEIRSVVLWVSDESSGLLCHASPSQSWPSVCSRKGSFIPLHSFQTSPCFSVSHGRLPGEQSCAWQLLLTRLGARVNVWLVWGGVIGCSCPCWWIAFWAPVSEDGAADDGRWGGISFLDVFF